MKITFSKSFIEFLESNKDSCVISRLLLKYNSSVNSYRFMFNFDSINYITFRKDGLISYLPHGKEHLTNDDGTWQKKNRQDGKPGKVIMQLFSDKAKKVLKSSLFENFGNKYKGYFQDYTIQLLPASEVKRIYKMTCIEGGASLQSSCMQGKNSDYLDLYSHCDKLQIAVIIKDDILCGRALVWNLEGLTFIDRFYVGADYLYETFVNYATANNMWYKKDYKSYSDKRVLINPVTKESESKTLKVYTDTEFDYYPYIDTFSYGSDGFISNSDNNTEYEYNDTGGDRSGGDDSHDDESYDDINDCYISQDDAVYIEYGDRGYRNRTCHVEDCIMVNDSWYYKDDSHIVEVDNNYYLTDDDNICIVDGEYQLTENCVYDDENSEYILSEDGIEVDGNTYNVNSDSIVEVNNTWYKKDSEEICVIAGQYYEVSDSDVIMNEETGEYELIGINDPLQTKLELV